MSQENIWEQSLGDENVRRFLIRRNWPHELTEVELRNYFNTHKLEDISLDSLYDYFKDNMFRDYEGLYLPHLLCKVPFTYYQKIYNALDEVLKVISPNMGSLTNENFNYFQYLMLVWRQKGLQLEEKFRELYELGIKHGLELDYLDMRGFSNSYYYMASAPFRDIEKNYKVFLENDRRPNVLVDILKRRLCNGENFVTCLSRNVIFKEIYSYSLNNSTKLFEDMYDYKCDDTKELKLCRKIAKEASELKK